MKEDDWWECQRWIAAEVDHVATLLASVMPNGMCEFENSTPVIIDDEQPSLLVLQDEWATVSTTSRLQYVGSTEATTCILLFLENKQEKLVSVAHYSSEDDCPLTVQAQVKSILGNSEAVKESTILFQW